MLLQCDLASPYALRRAPAAWHAFLSLTVRETCNCLTALLEESDSPLPAEASTFLHDWLGEGWRAAPLHGDASVRGYFRVTGHDGASYVLAYYPEQVRNEVARFIGAYEAIAPHGRVPEVLKHSLFAVAQRDVGDQTLYDLLVSDRKRAMPFYRQAIDLLLQFQGAPGQEINVPFTAESFQAELEMTRQFYVERLMGAAGSQGLVPWFERLATKVAAHPYVLCHRDYHGQNLHVFEDALYMIDYQDMRMGPDTYDLASLLRDRGAADLVGAEAEVELVEYYRASRAADEALVQRYYETLLQRSIKILGTFAKQPLVRGRMHYLDFIPPTISSIRLCLRQLPEFAPMAAELPLDFSLEKARRDVASRL
jgi:aminoglycoside/choline kinase family phosphotransferase